MWQALLAEQNLVFSTALALMLLIGAVEVASLLLGGGLSDTVDALLPEVDLNAHAEVGSVEGASSLTRLLGWLRIGQVPLLMLLVVFLFSFGLLGLLLQAVALAMLGYYLSVLLAAPLVLIATLPCVRALGGVLERVMPRDETTAVSDDALLGRIATITLGTATAAMPAEAKVRDQHGYTHYVQVVPEDAEQQLQQGSRILLVSRRGGVYAAIENHNPNLNDA